MFRISLVTKPLTKVAFTTTLVLSTIAAYSSNTQAQVPSTSSKSNPSGCLSGYPDGKYQGDRPVTRYEFAAGMNACLERVNQLLPNKDNMATREDFEALIKRQQELNEQLRELNGRVSKPAAERSE